MKESVPEEAGFQARRTLLLDLGIAPDIYGTAALWSLVTGRDRAAANQVLRRAAEWFDHPHPDGRDLQGEPDFAAIKLCRVWHRFGTGDQLEEVTRESIWRFFLARDFASRYQSENHGLLFHTARFLMAAALPAEQFTAYQSLGSEMREEDGAWLKRFLRYRAGHGWGEFDSAAYLAPVWECLCTLFDFSPDAELKRLAGMTMDLLLADMEVDSLRGWYGGAHGRIYPRHALDHADEPTTLLHYLYFGDLAPEAARMHGFIIDALDSSYRPHPRLAELALCRTAPYENRERKHLHNVADMLPEEPLSGSLRKYTYWTPDHVMGCVQFQDAYPAGDCPFRPHHYGLPIPPDERETARYAHHQQHQWDLSFGTRPDARLFTHHPGDDGTHNHWTGDRLCGCGHFFQHRDALVALYDIPPDQPHQFIHAYLPKAAFDEVVGEGRTLLVRAGNAFAALTFSSAFHWTDAGEWRDREVVSMGARHGVVCEAGSTANFPDFAAFRQSMRDNAIRFDAERMELEYRSTRNGTLRIDVRGGRWLDGRKADLDYPTYGSPHLRSEWGSGRVELGSPDDPLRLDFHVKEESHTPVAL